MRRNRTPSARQALSALVRCGLPCGFATLAACSPAPGAADPSDPPPPLPAAHAPPPLAHHSVRFDDLPPPHATPSAFNPPVIVPRPPGAQLRLPPGFRIAPYAEGGFDLPRWVAVSPNGDAFVSDSLAGTIIVLRGVDSRGRARERHTFATGLTQPFGIAFMPGYVYVGDVDEVLRFPYQPGDTQATGPAETIAPLPGGGYHEHWTRNLLFSKDFQKLYVTVGSSTNDEPESDPERAAVLEMNPDGRERRILVSGTRNPIGLARGPDDALWAGVQERDDLGDGLVPDYVTRLDPGAFYGWPYAYLGSHEDPAHRGEHPDLVAKTRTPDLLLDAHVAVMDLVFYDGAMFPPDWRGDVILSFHGSWNRAQRVGYQLARVHMSGAQPAGGYDDFVTGWMLGPNDKRVWGRPVGLAVLGDGSLLVVDDGGRMVWRVTYGGGS